MARGALIINFWCSGSGRKGWRRSTSHSWRSNFGYKSGGCHLIWWTRRQAWRFVEV